jgi:hypothetical protein
MAKEPRIMSVFSARILSKDGVVVAETVEIWMDIVRREQWEEWYGSFDVSLEQHEVLGLTVYHVQLADGRIGEIMITDISGSEKIHYVFQGLGAVG